MTGVSMNSAQINPATLSPTILQPVTAPDAQVPLGSAIDAVRTALTPVEAGVALRNADALTGDPVQTNQLVAQSAGGAVVSSATANPTQGSWVNPTGGAIRVDAGGDGHYGASRSRVGGVHYGVDYSGVAGQAVVAPISGTITATRAGPHSVLGGFNIVSDDGQTRVTVLYAPLNAGLNGTRVEAGQAVATQADLQTFNASKGRSEYPANVGDHVHVQAQVGGRRVDPTSYIAVPN